MDSQVGLQYLARKATLDEAELYELMTAYGDDVRRYAYAITKNREQAKDVAQETFLRAYRGFGSFQGRSSLKTWLFSIARNAALNEMKSSYMRRIVLFEWVKPRGVGESAETEYLEEQSVREIREALMSLSIKLREVLLLSLEHGLTMPEIAELLHVSEGTVKSRMHRARQAMERKRKEMER
ncbi:RNA polymerase sigma factor [Cohnella cellulosilytica]|uniref:RNA polymerase sigma factor n=1 Tax=Cohnella cellulosilytica TaxID=986710 RepID=A0ABW2FAY8_9BACL